MKLLKNPWTTPVLLILILVAVIINIAVTLEMAEEHGISKSDMYERNHTNDMKENDNDHRWWFFDDDDELEESAETIGQETVTELTLDSANFVSVIDNPYYTLKPGMTWTYSADTEDGMEKNIIIVTEDTKVIRGVTNIVVWDRVWLDDELIEETYDWFAQDKEGNVWYFGEDSKEYENGKVTSSAGSWEAGVDGAEQGIIMKANPKVGDSYRQEYYKGEAEDMADVLSVDETVSIAYGTFNKCLKTRDYSNIEPDLNEYKYYCSEVGGFIMEEVVETGDIVELIKFEQ